MSSIQVVRDGASLTITVDTMAWFREQAVNVNNDHFGPLPSARDDYNAAVGVFQAALNAAGVSATITLGPYTLPAVPAAAPGDAGGGAGIDPQNVLQQIVDAINSAESTLNTQNFVIATGSIDAKLALPVGEIAITLGITPKPYA